MNQAFTLPVIGASLILAIGGGLRLGESTVGLINPIHFQGPAVHPRDRGAAIEERSAGPRWAEFVSDYGWAEGQRAKAADCGDCEALDARDAHSVFYAQPEPEVRIHRASIAHWDQPQASAPVEPGEFEQQDEEEPGAQIRARIDRYAYYEIEVVEEELGEVQPSEVE